MKYQYLLLIVSLVLVNICSFSNAQTYNKFTVTSSTSGSSCEASKSPYNATVGVCSSVCENNFSINSTNTANTFKFTTFSNAQCSGDYLTYSTFVCTNSSVKITQTPFSVVCISSGTTPTPKPTSKPDDSSDASLVKNSSIAIVLFFSMLIGVFSSL